ncbi:MAG: TonB-dependent receptor [Glaciecola sp.]|jgi:TonB-dependent receptor|uniref:TonB-dependent receptor n=1 Tax=Congregibacter sp. TaxID=2744308 RepID=UPI0039E6B1C3
MANKTLRKNPLATAVALAVGTLLAPTAAMSQEQVNSGALEEVVVVGIRASLAASADIKRYSEGVVDAISAEDIGAMPDTNLAESLQRITGVSIDRTRGEGSKVTVRGFGPEYNLVTVNGRQMPTHQDRTRSFDFADIASEGVAGVEVFKTSRAELPTGGIGSTINIKTQRPLEMRQDRIFTIGGKAVHDTSADSVNGDDLTPELSGLFAQVFADGTFGVSLAGSYQDRNQGVDSAQVNGWYPLRGDAICCSWTGAEGANDAWPGIPNDANQVNRPTDSAELYAVPQQLQYRRESFERERINGNLTLQWAPTETITTTLDIIYSTQDIQRSFNDYSAWFSLADAASRSSEWTDGPVAGPIEYSETYGGSDTPMGVGVDSTKSENLSVGFNAVWDATDRLSLEFDYHDSSAERSPNGPLGSSMSLAITSPLRTRASGFFATDLPILSVGFRDGQPLSPNDMLIGGSVFTNEQNEMNIEQAKIAGKFDFNDITSINFGIQTTEVDNVSQQATTQRDTWGGVGAPGDIADLLSPASMADWFEDFGNAGDERRTTQLFTWDTNALIDRARELEAQGVSVSNASTIPGDCGDGFCPSTAWTRDQRTQEEQTAAYIQVDFDLEWGDRAVNLNLGVRYEDTDVASQALVPVIDRFDWITANELTAVTQLDANGVAVQDFTSLTGSYDNVLPNIDFNIEILQDVMFRASWSETMSRPGYESIQGGLTVGGCTPGNGCDGFSGDPSLQPLESENLDFSFEWYYGETSYVALGYFKKDVTNFLGESFNTGVELFPELGNPTTGGLAAQARAAGAATGDDVRQYIFTNFANDPSVDVANQIITGTTGNDPMAFRVRVPSNQEQASIDGWEFALQHAFADTGFGFVVNYTVVDGDVGYDNLVRPEEAAQFALLGLSDSANFVGFYDKNGIEVRLAYNWRDDFLGGIGTDAGGAQPRYTEEYGQWDARASYRFGGEDQYIAFFEGINVTDETFREHSRSPLNVLQAGQTGSRWALGFRANF